MEDKKLIKELVQRSGNAQEKYAHATQEEADKAARAICKVVNDNAEYLAELAVKETGMGVYEDKITKCRTKSRLIWNNLKDKKSVGVLQYLADRKIAEVAKPMGVVCCIAPCTNPVVTPMSNCAFALKCRNSVIIAPHPRAKECTKVLTEMFRNELSKLGLPEDLILTVEEPSLQRSTLLMQAVDVIIATGGMGMVRSAYSSGRPAYGVGAGNVQCIIDKGVDYLRAAEDIILGRTFDNGIICLAEQSVIIPAEDRDKIIEALETKGAFLINRKQTARLREVLFPEGGAINKKVVGQSVEYIARLAEIRIPAGTKALLAEAEGAGKRDVLSREKMCPVLALYESGTFEEAVGIALQNLLGEGKGHSTVVHSQNEEHIGYAQEMLPVSRLIINQPSGTSGGGSWYNGYTPTTTLGCGTWGNNSISDNFNYTHLMNITRVGYKDENAAIPSDDEIWTERT